jgi:hypothetical protein
LRQVNRGIVSLKIAWNQAVPLWLAVLFLAFCIFAGKAIVMMGGMR